MFKVVKGLLQSWAEQAKKRGRRGKAEIHTEKRRAYAIGKVIGEGTYGHVKECVHKPTGEHLAVKVVQKSSLKSCGHREVHAELAALTTIRHPNVIALRDWFETPEKYYLIFDLARGGELFTRIVQKGRFNERNAASVIHIITEAVQFLHEHHMVHRDLKPENLLYLDAACRKVVIADFGVAKLLENSKQVCYTVCGSPGYCAPEMLDGKGHGKKVDSWAIGAITYTLLSGCSPFGYGETTEEMSRLIHEGTLSFSGKLWRGISAEAVDFIRRMMDKNPRTRFSCQEALGHPWLRALHQELSPADGGASGGNVPAESSPENKVLTGPVSVSGTRHMSLPSQCLSRSSPPWSPDAPQLDRHQPGGKGTSTVYSKHNLITRHFVHNVQTSVRGTYHCPPPATPSSSSSSDDAAVDDKRPEWMSIFDASRESVEKT